MFEKTAIIFSAFKIRIRFKLFSLFTKYFIVDVAKLFEHLTERESKKVNVNKLSSLESWLNVPAIVIDYNGNISVGFVAYIGKYTVSDIQTLVLRDYISDKDVFVLANIYHYSHELLELITKLSVRDLQLLMNQDPTKHFDSMNIEEKRNLSEIKIILKINGFYSKLFEYLEVDDKIEESDNQDKIIQINKFLKQ